jgi:pantoate--beta-alanine ligase
VVSIFVNPTQFGPAEDLDRYPQDFERDCRLLVEGQVDILFAPVRENLYPQGFCTEVKVTGITNHLCGASRPWHFPGVALIVCKLFNLVRPHITWFGQKDYQQCQVIRRMTLDLDFDIEIRIGAIVRETDGLAMSSRNKYLSPEERSQATVLYRALQEANRLWNDGEHCSNRLISRMQEIIAQASLARVDYINIVDADKLVPVEEFPAPVEGELSTQSPVQQSQVVALAVFFGKTRLIDNIILV